MPALQPPSMQIGTVPPGYAPTAVTGPAPGPSAPSGSFPNFFQSAGAATSASGPVNISQTVTATRPGTTLIWAVVVNGSAATALGGTPTGWALVTSQTVATLALGVYSYVGNPGGLTSVTFSSNATATTGGISSWFWELGNAPTRVSASVSANGSSTALASSALTSGVSSALVLGIGAWVLGTSTLAGTQTGGTGWLNNAQQSSTAGTTNAAVQTSSTFSGVGTQAALNETGTLSVSSVWAAALILIPTTASAGLFAAAPSHALAVDQGAGYGVGDTGGLGFALGNTKPGGAGGGQ